MEILSSLQLCSPTVVTQPVFLLCTLERHYTEALVLRHCLPRMANLREELERLGLSEYLEAFVAEGFDTWEAVLDITESDL